MLVTRLLNLLRPIAMLSCGLPLALLLWDGLQGRLGSNPVERLIGSSGDWSLWLLLATLAVTPLRKILGLHALARWRRFLGVWSFIYSLLHLAAYAWLELGLDLAEIMHDLLTRPMITVGWLALLFMLPLGATSSNGAIRWLGAAKWQRLHRLVYLVAILSLLHFFLKQSGKQDFAEVWIKGAILALLLGWRLYAFWQRGGFARWRERGAQGCAHHAHDSMGTDIAPITLHRKRP